MPQSRTAPKKSYFEMTLNLLFASANGTVSLSICNVHAMRDSDTLAEGRNSIPF